MEDFPRVREPADEGMVPMFDLVNSFLNALAPVTWAEMDPFIDTDDSSMIPELKQIAWYWWGFVLCLALGLLFMVLMPIVGCAVCCCRTCCGCCQEQNDVKKGKKSPPSCCKTVTCSLTLLILAGTMAAAISVAFFALPMMANEINPSTDTGFRKDLNESKYILGDYLNSAAHEIEVAIIPPLNETIELVLDGLEEMPSTTFDDLATETGLDPALYELQSYTNSLYQLQLNLTAMETLSDSLEMQRQELDVNLTNSRNNINNTLVSCGNTSDCDWLKLHLDDLRSWAVYVNLSETSTAAGVINESLTSGLDDTVNTAVHSFELIEQLIDNQTNAAITDIEESVYEAEKQIIKLVEDGTAIIRTLSHNIISVVVDIGASMEDIEKYSSYVYIGIYCVYSLAITVATLYLLGLLLGIICGPGGSKHGANCIMAGMTLTFLFSFIFWLLTVIFMAVGGTMYVTTCRHLIALDESFDVVTQYIFNKNNITTYTNVSDALTNCQSNQSLYVALNVEQRYNVTEAVYTTLVNIEQAIKDYPFEGFSIKIEPIALTVNATMFAIYEETMAIDFNSYYTELAKNVTFIPLPEYISHMYAVAYNSTGDLNSNLTKEAEELDDIYKSYVIPMETEREQLLSLTNGSEIFIKTNDIPVIMRDLEMAETVLDTEGEEIVNASIRRQVNETYIYIETFLLGILHSLETDVAACYPIYDAYGTAVQAPCVYFLEPLNALWFFLGWFLAFGIFAICFASGVAGVFLSKAIMPKTSQVDTFGDYPMVNYKR